MGVTYCFTSPNLRMRNQQPARISTNAHKLPERRQLAIAARLEARPSVAVLDKLAATVDGRKRDAAHIKRIAWVIIELHLVGGGLFTRRKHLACL